MARVIEAPPRLAEYVAGLLRGEILAGAFAQGEHLVEARIAERLSVSRGPVREALRTLRAEGLVRELPRRGIFAADFTSSDIRDIYELRAAIEGRSAWLIASRMPDPETVTAIRKLAADLNDAVEGGDILAVAECDLNFHAGICQLSGNKRLDGVFRGFLPTLRALFQMDERMYPIEDVAGLHDPMVVALTEGQAEDAASLFQLHCERAGEVLAEYFSAQSTP